MLAAAAVETSFSFGVLVVLGAAWDAWFDPHAHRVVSSSVPLGLAALVMGPPLGAGVAWLGWRRGRRSFRAQLPGLGLAGLVGALLALIPLAV